MSRWRKPVAIALVCGAAAFGVLVLLTLWGLRPAGNIRLQNQTALGALLAGLAHLAWPRRERARGTGLVFAFALALFCFNHTEGGSGDTLPARTVMFHAVREGTLRFDTETRWYDPSKPLPYWFMQLGAHSYSHYPVATPMLAAPVFLLAMPGWSDLGGELTAPLAKLAAAWLAAWTVALVFLTLERLTSRRAAAIASALLAAGTAMLPILSQALWQHTGGAFCVAAALWALFVLEGAPRALGVGLAAGCAIAARPFDAVAAAGLGLALIAVERRWWLAIATGLAPVALLMAYDRAVFGSPFATGYGDEASQGWSARWIEGFPGLLVSPGRGLFAYAPVLLFAIPGLVRPGLDGRRGLAVRMLGATALAFTIAMGKWWCWGGGWCRGPRMLGDVLPIFALGLGLYAERALAAAWSRRALAATAVVSIAIHALVSFGPAKGGFEAWIVHPDPIWSWRAYPPVALFQK